MCSGWILVEDLLGVCPWCVPWFCAGKRGSFGFYAFFGTSACIILPLPARADAVCSSL